MINLSVLFCVLYMFMIYKYCKKKKENTFTYSTYCKESLCVLFASARVFSWTFNAVMLHLKSEQTLSTFFERDPHELSN